MSPGDQNFSFPTDASIREAAARWVVRRDRSLSENETAEFERWLQIDPRHAAAVARSSIAWRMLDRVPASVAHPIADETARRTVRPWVALGGLAAAALVFLCVNVWWPAQLSRKQNARPARDSFVSSTTVETKVLADGTSVCLNVASEIVEDFTTTERKVRLVRGEAFFSVVTDPDRPFIVHVGEVMVRAVGTGFNVQMQALVVEILVTEGKVQVDVRPSGGKLGSIVTGSAADTDGFSATSPLVAAGQRAVVAIPHSSARPKVVVSTVNSAELEQVIAWRKPWLRLSGSTLAELAAEFERQTSRRIVLADPTLGELRVGGRFRSDDLEGFARVLEENYGIQTRREADGTLFLGKSP